MSYSPEVVTVVGFRILISVALIRDGMAQKGAISLDASQGNRQVRFSKYIFVPGSLGISLRSSQGAA